MGVVNTSYTFTANDTITSAKMNNIIDDTIMTGTAVAGNTLQVTPSGQLTVNSQGITSNELASDAVTSSKIYNLSVTTAKIADANVTQIKLGSNISGNGPAFRAYSSSQTSISSDTFTKISLAVEVFDTNSNFASSRFTPTVAGYYLVSGCVAFATVGTTGILSAIAKNGSTSSPQTLGSGQTDSPSVRSNVSDIIYLNGSTDYVELCGFHSKAGGASTSGNEQTYFSACLIRSA